MVSPALSRLRETLTARLQALAPSAARTAQGEAQAVVPVGDGRDGGHLRDCIFVQAQENARAATVTARNPHAAAVELGTSRMRARPYLIPGFLAGARRMREGAARVLRK